MARVNPRCQRLSVCAEPCIWSIYRLSRCPSYASIWRGGEESAGTAGAFWERSRTGLALEFRRGAVRALDDTLLFDRALASVLGNLRRLNRGK
ncbi:hypothetical protein EAH78_00510 [Pseudomonas arsenicoxydans]|uniref:Uncharacterized protein n=1 Tax=Pseudomonas arsenicoxydans TaxID=702115 RepID=A0A502I381_9PSED|nr:hypothetical protein EAH78_00510 [Pseudomonas arsenicoxydans]